MSLNFEVKKIFSEINYLILSMFSKNVILTSYIQKYNFRISLRFIHTLA